MRAFIVVDLGFGDAGKGLITDYLVRRHAAKLVVRFNGGAQAGHNVVTPGGRHHTFAQFGSGTFVAGVRTFLSRYVVIHPTALLVEAEVLRRTGVSDALDRLFISENARIITPFLYPEDTLRARDLRDRPLARQKLARIRERRWESIPLKEHPEAAIFEDPSISDAWLEHASRLSSRTVPDSMLGRLAESSTTVFEGAQGVLIDESFGFHPYTTWSDCTPRNAFTLVTEHMPNTEPDVIGVLRTYIVRHGPGPLPSETDALTVLEHNHEHPWQGPVRYGWFDAVLARYALAACSRVDRLAITHVDLSSQSTTWNVCHAWSVDGQDITTLALPQKPSLDHQERLTSLARRARPVLEAIAPSAALETIAALLDRRIHLASYGPTAADIRPRIPGS